MALFGLGADSEKRAKKFISEVIKTGIVYCLKKDDSSGVETSSSNDFLDNEGNASTVIPFWSRSYIPYAKKWGGNASLCELILEDFLQLWLTGMHNDGVIVGLNWDQNGIGDECPPHDLLDQFQADRPLMK